MRSSSLETALAVAMNLSEEDRRALLDLIFQSLPDDSEDIEYDASQIVEWNRRVDEYRAGRTQALPVEDVLARIRKKFDR